MKVKTIEKPEPIRCPCCNELLDYDPFSISYNTEPVVTMGLYIPSEILVETSWIYYCFNCSLEIKKKVVHHYKLEK